jgi:hypothetical protein
MANNWTLKGRRAKPRRLGKFRSPKNTSREKGFSMIPKMNGETVLDT